MCVVCLLYYEIQQRATCLGFPKGQYWGFALCCMTNIWLRGIWHATCWEWKYSFDFPLTPSISVCMFSSDPTLTVENVTKVMGEVENWWAIGTSLHVLHFKLKEIKYQFSAMKDGSHALGEYWIKTDPDASWENLASQLYMNGEERAATLAKQFLPSGMHTCNLTYILAYIIRSLLCVLT